MYGKKTGKRLLSWVLVLIMALSMLPLNVLADEVGGDSVIYGHYEGNNWASGPNANAPSLPEGVDSVSKTAVPTGNPNEYRYALAPRHHLGAGGSVDSSNRHHPRRLFLRHHSLHPQNDRRRNQRRI